MFLLIAAIVVAIVVAVIVATTKGNKSTDKNTYVGGGNFGGGGGGTWGTQPSASRNSTLSGKSPTESGAKKSEKEEIERCYFDNIDLIVKNVSKKIDQTIKVNDSKEKNIYIISNDRKGETLQVNIVRKNADKCLYKDKDDRHSKYSITKNGEVKSNSINQKEFTVFYKKISEEHLDASFLYYFFLPISDNASEKYLLKFESCRERPQCNVIVYPDVEYDVTFGIDFGKHDSAKEKLYLKFSSKYNGGFKKEFEISNEKIEPAGPADLKNKTEKFQKVCQAFKLLSESKDLVAAFPPSPIVPVIKDPNVAFDLKWCYVTSKDCLKIGRKICAKLQAKPLLGVEWTINLLEIGLNALAPGLGTLVRIILDFTKDCDVLSVNIECKLVIKGDINLFLDDIEINTAEINKSKENIIKGEGKIAVELVAGASGKTKILCFEAGAEASAKGVASFTAGGKLLVEVTGVFLDTYVDFDGLKIMTKIQIEAGVSEKKISYTNENEIVLIEKKEKILGIGDKKELISFK